MDRFTHDVHLYYGANAQPPKVPGAMAIAVNTAGHATQWEIDAGKRRPDIGLITVRDIKTGETTTIQTEHQEP